MDTNTVRQYNLGSDQAHRGPCPGGHRQGHCRLRLDQEEEQKGDRHRLLQVYLQIEAVIPSSFDFVLLKYYFANISRFYLYN